jgi:hypothetical protein
MPPCERPCERRGGIDAPIGVQFAKGVAPERVSLEVECCDPDPYRGQELHECESPVGEQQLHAVEEHHERPDDECERGKDPPRLAEGQHGVLHGLLILVADRSEQRRRMFGPGGAHAAHTLPVLEAPPLSDGKWIAYAVFGTGLFDVLVQQL